MIDWFLFIWRAKQYHSRKKIDEFLILSFLHQSDILRNITFYMFLCGRRAGDCMVVGFITTCVILSPIKLWDRFPLMARYTRYNNMWSSLSVNCGRSVVFSGYSGFLHKKNPGRYDITDILLKVALSTITLILFYVRCCLLI